MTSPLVATASSTACCGCASSTGAADGPVVVVDGAASAAVSILTTARQKKRRRRIIVVTASGLLLLLVLGVLGYAGLDRGLRNAPFRLAARSKNAMTTSETLTDNKSPHPKEEEKEDARSSGIGSGSGSGVGSSVRGIDDAEGDADGRPSGSVQFDYFNNNSLEDKAVTSTSPPWSNNNNTNNENLCDRSQIIDGQWHPIRLRKPPYYPPSNNTSCNYKALYSRKGYNTYQWRPNNTSCTLSEWDTTTFCQLADRATMLIVGDSLSWEHYVSTVHLLGIHATHMYSRMSKDFGTNIGHAVCQGRARLVYRRFDNLDTNVRHALLENNTHIPQIVVLNRGAHYEDDIKFMAGVQSALDVVQEWLEQCDQLQIKCHFFWRTTVPGHLNCRTFKKPVNDKMQMEAYVNNLSLYDNHTRTFHWYDFQHQNLLVESELESRRRSNQLAHYRMVDGYHINVLRPDAHSDCLHSCCPGKMDVYAQLILHYLNMDRHREDVEQLRRVYDEQQWDVNVTTPYVFCPSCQ